MPDPLVHTQGSCDYEREVDRRPNRVSLYPLVLPLRQPQPRHGAIQVEANATRILQRADDLTAGATRVRGRPTDGSRPANRCDTLTWMLQLHDAREQAVASERDSIEPEIVAYAPTVATYVEDKLR